MKSAELSVIELVMNATIFTKAILFVLLGLSVVSWSIMVNKYMFTKRYQDAISRFLTSLTAQANLSSIEDCCVRFGSGEAKALPLLLLKMIRAAAQGKPVFFPETVMNTAVTRESASLQYGMSVLATAASASPLLGLLGTVWGVMYSFINIGQAGSASIAAVAPGIAEALMTTIAGLCVAIPAMVGHTVLMGYINQSLDTLDRVNELAGSMFKKGAKA